MTTTDRLRLALVEALEAWRPSLDIGGRAWRSITLEVRFDRASGDIREVIVHPEGLHRPNDHERA